MKSLSINIDEKKIENELSELAIKKYRDIGNGILSEYFHQKINGPLIKKVKGLNL